MIATALDLDGVLNLRLVVARFGEMGLAKWWSTTGPFRVLGLAALRRGFPRSHRFAQAHPLFAVAAHRRARDLHASNVHVVEAVLGDTSIRGNIKPLLSLTEPLQVANDNGARQPLVPIENERNFLDVSTDMVEQVDPNFFGGPKTAAMKPLGGG
jgi:hypothetical protein